MKIVLGEKYLITTNDWFFGTNGEQYKAVFGTVKSINSDDETLGIKTNRGSTNWYVEIGNMLIAGCQIFYAIKTDIYSSEPPIRELEINGDLKAVSHKVSRIFNADKN